MCVFLALVAAMVAGTLTAAVLLLLRAGARFEAEATCPFPADRPDPLIPRDRNGNPSAF